MSDTRWMNVAFPIKGSTVQTLWRISKHVSTSCVGKKYLTYSGWFFLPSLRFYELVREKSAALWVVLTLLSHIYSAYVSSRRCHKQAPPSKWSQLIALDSLPETAALGRGSVLRECSELSFYAIDGGVRKCQRTFRLMMASSRPVLCHSECLLKRQRDDIFTGAYL